MKRVRNLTLPAILLLASAVLTPARAQFGGGMEQMEQFAPMLEMMKKHMGKKRFARLMQTVGPMMGDMMDGQGTSGGFGGFGGRSYESFDMSRMAGMIDGRMIAGLVEAFDDGQGRRGRRTRRR